jgi:catechol 2,3-dioxygenase-like lactoylglutathione lyase family enzyme
MIKMVRMVGINISNQQRALDFYTGKLGFEVHIDQPMGGNQRWIELRVPGSDTHVTLFTPPGHEDRIGTFVNLVFGTEDVEKTFEELKARGVEFAQPPRKESWGTSAIFKDPDGNSFVLSSLA